MTQIRPEIQDAVDSIRVIDTHEHLEEESTIPRANAMTVFSVEAKRRGGGGTTA